LIASPDSKVVLVDDGIQSREFPTDRPKLQRVFEVSDHFAESYFPMSSDELILLRDEFIVGQIVE
jgi:hypothetical protein